MKKLILAALALFMTVAPARAVECDQLTTGLQICLPRYGTDFDQWAQADINALTLLNGSATVAGSSPTFAQIWVSTIAGRNGSGVYISSYVVVQGSGSFLASGSAQYSIFSASGIFINAGGIRFADGTFQYTGTPNFATLTNGTNTWTGYNEWRGGAMFYTTVTVRALTNIPQFGVRQNNTDDGWNLWADSDNGDLTFQRRESGSNTQRFRLFGGGGFVSGGQAIFSGSATARGDLKVDGSGLFGSTVNMLGGLGVTSLTASSGTFGPSLTAGTTAFAVSVTGVGIGTASPLTKLQVMGGATIKDGAFTVMGGTLTVSNRGGSDIAQIHVSQNNGDDGWKLHADSSVGYLAFQRHASGVATQKVQFADYGAGAIGIGVTPSLGMLHMDRGTGVGQATFDGSAGGCLMLRDTDDAGWTEVDALDGVLTASVDADGVCD